MHDPGRHPVRYGGWLALAVLVFFQVAWAGHEAQHTGSDLSDTCATCLQLDQNGSAMPPATPLHAMEFPAERPATVSEVRRTGRTRGAYESRGPPGP